MCRARISNLLGKITILVMLGLCVNTALALDGSGTEQDPWRIKSLDDFNDFAANANYWAGFTRLETDVNLAGLSYTTAVIAPDTYQNGLVFDGAAFTGVFYGNDHKIIGLTIDDGGAGNFYLGLFGYISGGEVRNLGLEGVSVSATGRPIGGLVGENGGSVSNCYSTGEVRGSGYSIGVGGLVGWNNSGDIFNCYSACDVNGFDDVGGLVGNSRMWSIVNCYSTGDVSGTGDHGHIGGLVGTNGWNLIDSYSTGDVKGYKSVGGLIGLNLNGIASNCYSTGDVNGGDAGIYIGGLVGHNRGHLLYCFWDMETQTHGVIESIGLNDSIAINVAGLPTSQLHQQSTFTNWDFINVWNIGENQTYPYLRKYSPANLNKDRKVDFLDIKILCEQWLQE